MKVATTEDVHLSYAQSKTRNLKYSNKQAMRYNIINKTTSQSNRSIQTDRYDLLEKQNTGRP